MEQAGGVEKVGPVKKVYNDLVDLHKEIKKIDLKEAWKDGITPYDIVTKGARAVMKAFKGIETAWMKDVKLPTELSKVIKDIKIFGSTGLVMKITTVPIDLFWELPQAVYDFFKALNIKTAITEGVTYLAPPSWLRGKDLEVPEEEKVAVEGSQAEEKPSGEGKKVQETVLEEEKKGEEQPVSMAVDKRLPVIHERAVPGKEQIGIPQKKRSLSEFAKKITHSIKAEEAAEACTRISDTVGNILTKIGLFILGLDGVGAAVAPAALTVAHVFSLVGATLAGATLVFTGVKAILTIRLCNKVAHAVDDIREATVSAKQLEEEIAEAKKDGNEQEANDKDALLAKEKAKLLAKVKEGLFALSRPKRSEKAAVPSENKEKGTDADKKVEEDREVSQLHLKVCGLGKRYAESVTELLDMIKKAEEENDTEALSQAQVRGAVLLSNIRTRLELQGGLLALTAVCGIIGVATLGLGAVVGIASGGFALPAWAVIAVGVLSIVGVVLGIALLVYKVHLLRDPEDPTLVSSISPLLMNKEKRKSFFLGVTKLAYGGDMSDTDALHKLKKIDDEVREKKKKDEEEMNSRLGRIIHAVGKVVNTIHNETWKLDFAHRAAKDKATKIFFKQVSVGA